MSRIIIQNLQLNLQKILTNKHQDAWQPAINKLFRDNCDEEIWNQYKNQELIRIKQIGSKNKSLQLNNSFLIRSDLTEYLKNSTYSIYFELRFSKDNSIFNNNYSAVEPLEDMDWTFVKVYSSISQKFYRVLYAKNTSGSGRAFNTGDESNTSMNICLIRT